MPVPPVGVLIVAGCGADVLINICLTLLGYVRPIRPIVPNDLFLFLVPRLTKYHKQLHPRPHTRLLRPLRLLQPRRPPQPRARPRHLLRPGANRWPRLPGGRVRHNQQPATPAGRLEGVRQYLFRLPARPDLPAAAGRRRHRALGLALRLPEYATGGQRRSCDVCLPAAPGRDYRLVLSRLSEAAGRRRCRRDSRRG